MTKENGRYIQLNGYPLRKPLWQTFLQSAAMQTGAVSALLLVASEMVKTGGHIAPSFAPFSLLIPFASAALGYVTEGTLIENILYSGGLAAAVAKDGNAKTLAIDTRPNDKTPPTSQANIQKAKLMRNRALAADFIMTCGMFGLTSQTALQKSLAIGDLVSQYAVMGGLVLPLFVTFAASALRFNKVVARDYVIVDAPPKKKAEAKAPAVSALAVSAPAV